MKSSLNLHVAPATEPRAKTPSGTPSTKPSQAAPRIAFGSHAQNRASGIPTPTGSHTSRPAVAVSSGTGCRLSTQSRGSTSLVNATPVKLLAAAQRPGFEGSTPCRTPTTPRENAPTKSHIATPASTAQLRRPQISLPEELLSSPTDLSTCPPQQQASCDDYQMVLDDDEDEVFFGAVSKIEKQRAETLQKRRRTMILMLPDASESRVQLQKNLAASIIQTYYRIYQARKMFTSYRSAAVTLQVLYLHAFQTI